MATPVPTDGSDLGAGEGIETPKYLAAVRRQRGETPNITEVGEGIITPETLRPREGQYNCPSELDWFHVADSHDKREPWMRDQVTRWLQAETAKHRATGGTFGDAEEEVEVKVRDEEVDSFIAAGRNATTQGLEGQMNILKMLIQAQSRQGVELSEEFLRKRLNALTKWMWGAVKSGQKLGGSPSGATSSVASGSDGGKPRGNDVPPPMVSEAQRERAVGRSAGRDEGTGPPEEALDVDMEEVGLQKALEQSLKESQRPGGEGGTADKMAVANAKTAALNFTGMGLSNAVRVQTPNNMAGTRSADMLGRSERIPSIGAQPEFDSEELETPGYSSMAFGADGDEAYGPYAEQEWSDGMPPAVAQNAIVRQIWNGYKKASWKWIVENRKNLGFETAIEELLTRHPRAQEMLGVGGNQDKTWLISGEGAPAKWLRDLDWGHPSLRVLLCVVDGSQYCYDPGKRIPSGGRQVRNLREKVRNTAQHRHA